MRLRNISGVKQVVQDMFSWKRQAVNVNTDSQLLRS
jgi:hypothetical protein